MGKNPLTRSIIDRAKLPEMFPTHAHSCQFWEQLGRTIGTFGFLEEVLGKAIFAFTATREYPPEQVEAAYRSWLPQLERALIDPLSNLAESYGKAVRENGMSTISNINELVEDIKKAAVIRNVLCHGSWGMPNGSGASVPFFVSRQMQIFETAIDCTYLRQVQAHVSDLVCSVMDSVTHMGWHFPGGAGPGKPIW